MAGFLRDVTATDVPTVLVVVILFVSVALLSTYLLTAEATGTQI
jgi:uncharacterized membrane protein YeiH